MATNLTVRQIQQALKDLGYDPGPIDGDLGPRTRAAVREFQKDRKFVVDGIVGPVTLGALAAESPKINLQAITPTPPAGAGRVIHTLVWHCTATPEGKEFSREQIRQMHLARGFSDIGYHKLVHLDGSVSDGRPESQIGAHVAGHNTGTIGYSYIGGVDAHGQAKDTRTPKQKETMVLLTRSAIAKYHLRAVLGHRDLSPDKDHDGVVEPFEWVKMCPCFNAIPEYGPLLRAAS